MKNNLSKYLIRLAMAAVPACASLKADVRLPAILSDHAVLQRAEKVPIWGHAAPGEKVTVSFGNKGPSGQTIADANGEWRIILNLKDAQNGPFELTIDGQNHLVIHDVLLGEVWVASGQSNMEFILATAKGAKEEILSSSNNLLREFRVHEAEAGAPAYDCSGHWAVASPSTTPNFSAVSYYFAKTLQHELNTPVGMINASLGGTIIESWISANSMEKDPELKSEAERMWQERTEYPAKISHFRADFQTWLKNNGREDIKTDQTLFLESEGPARWVSVKLPGNIRDPSLPLTGTFWIKKEISIPPEMAGRALPLNLEIIQGFESVYWNGQKIGETSIETFPGKGFRRSNGFYTVPAKLVKAGMNVLALRIFAPVQSPAISGYASLKAGQIALDGMWLVAMEHRLPDIDPKLTPTIPVPPVTLVEKNLASSLFNGMINPIIPCIIRGAIWYQGEANVSRAAQYASTLRLLIEDWREKWNIGTIPFLICQLPNYGAKKDQPADSAWAELREAQWKVGLPATRTAVLIDVGDENNLHPPNKKDPGERLARLALDDVYHKAIISSGPQFEKMSITGNKIRIHFRHCEGGLITRSQLTPTPTPPQDNDKKNPPSPSRSKDEVSGFSICGTNGQWTWARGTIEGDTIVVWSPGILDPIAVRYAWSDSPSCNLYNGEGLPAVPFRTDNFPLSTARQRY